MKLIQTLRVTDFFKKGFATKLAKRMCKNECYMLVDEEIFLPFHLLEYEEKGSHSTLSIFFCERNVKEVQIVRCID